MAENFITSFWTWVTGNVITADRLNGNVNNIINGLNGGTKTINVGKMQIGDVDVVNSLREATFTKITIGNTVIDNTKNAKQDFSKSAISTGVTIATIALGDNSGAVIEIFGSGLVDAVDISTCKMRFSVYRTTGTITISLDSEFRDGGAVGYFDIEQSGDDIIIKAFTDDSGTWTVSGQYKIESSGTITIS